VSRPPAFLPAFLLLVSLVASGCGRDAPEPVSRPGLWHLATLEGISGASGLAVLDDVLLFCAEGDRNAVYVLPIADVEKGEGASLLVRALPVEVDRESTLGGAGPFARQGYRLGDLWDLPVDWQGIAVQAPNFVFLAERTHRVVYVGRLRMGAGRHLQGVVLERAFVVPGGDRAGAEAADWRDRGPGLAGLASVVGERRTEDLYAADRGGASPGTFRLQKLDRYGLGLGWFQVHVPDATEIGLGALLKEEGRYLFVRGEGRGVIQPCLDGPTGGSVWAGRGVPGPEAPEGGAWTGMERGPEGVLYLVSGGIETRLAWRPPSSPVPPARPATTVR
jgi:hypothetical protein